MVVPIRDNGLPEKLMDMGRKLVPMVLYGMMENGKMTGQYDLIIEHFMLSHYDNVHDDVSR